MSPSMTRYSLRPVLCVYCVCIYIYIYLFICIYTYTYYVYVCIHIYIYVQRGNASVYVHMHIRSFVSGLRSLWAHHINMKARQVSDTVA